MIRSAFDLAAAVPWAMTPDSLDLVLRIADRAGEGPEAVALRTGQPLQNSYAVEMRGDVAVIPLMGPIFRRANLFTELSGATSTELFARDIQAAVDDPSVKAILLNIDSPGGEANGVNETAKLIAAARGVKPIKAYVGGMAASGGYWLACAADEIVIDDTAMLGSIGAVSRYVSTRGRDERNGTRVIEIVSTQSPRKRPDPETDDGKAALQEVIDALAQCFVESVAANRGVPVDTVLADFGKGGMLIGAQAVNAGLADRIGSFETLLAEMNRQARPGATGSSTVQAKEQLMTITAADITAPYIATNFPAVAEALRAEGRDAATGAAATAQAQAVAQARAEGVTAERERILGIEAVALPGYEQIVSEAKADGTSTAGTVSVRIIAAQKQAGIDLLDQRRKTDDGLPAIKPSTDADRDAPPDPALPIEDRAKAEWSKSADLRTEFGGNLDSYVAYRKAEDAGRVRRFTK